MAHSVVSHVQPTEDNKTHIVHFTTAVPIIVFGNGVVTTKIEIGHPHTDKCAFCAALSGTSPASVEDNHLPRKYRSMMKTVLFPGYLLLCAATLGWGSRTGLSFLHSKAFFDTTSGDPTMILFNEAWAEVVFYRFVLLAVLAAVYLRAW